MTAALTAIPAATGATTWSKAAEAFLGRDLAPGSRRIYRLTLSAVAALLPAGVRLGDLSTRQIAEALHAAYPTAAPNSWNRSVATLRSFAAFCERHGWVGDRDDLTRALERRRAPEDHSKGLSREDLDRLLSDRDVAVRDRCLWRVLYETAGRAEEILGLNVEDLDTAITFYSTLFGTPPAKARPGYANFAVAEPPLKLVLIENPGQGGSLNHLGVEVESSQQVHSEIARLSAAGQVTAEEIGQTCCYASQEPVWVTGPSGARWEGYTGRAHSGDVA